MKDKLISWLEHIYANNGLWAAVIVGLLIVALLVAGSYLDISLVDILK